MLIQFQDHETVTAFIVAASSGEEMDAGQITVSTTVHGVGVTMFLKKSQVAAWENEILRLADEIRKARYDAARCKHFNDAGKQCTQSKHEFPIHTFDV